MRELVAPARRQPEIDIALRKTCQITREIEQLLGDEMNDVALPLNCNPTVKAVLR